MSLAEVKVAATENRHELVLFGHEVSKKIEENGLDPALFDLINLNYLSISKTCLNSLSSGLSKLTNLTNLVLHNNKIETFPEEICLLSKLKFLDISNNEIHNVPAGVSELKELESFNISVNKLSEFPPVGDMLSLHVFNVAHNELEKLPDGIFNAKLVHLSKIIAGSNKISSLSTDVKDLPHLNLLDLSQNNLTDVPAELSECLKLKELDLKGNKFKDRRFGKLVEQCPTKSVIDYLSNILKKEREQSGKKSKGKGKKNVKPEDTETESLKDVIKVLHFQSEETRGAVVHVTPAVMSVRPNIVCCIIRNVNFLKSDNLFKQFIVLQTKLHDTVCMKRQAATIATHDLKSVKMPLTFDAKFPSHLLIVPLSRQKEVTGEKLVADLMKEAEDLRKEKKRNTVSGIHKYLDLLKEKTQYPCLMDSGGAVISFPPITNSDKTKISKDTTDIFVEVTSSTSLDVCKKVCDELILKMLEMGLGADTSEEAAAGPCKKTLIVEQVKVTDQEGNLRVVYPSRTDLNSELVVVMRNYD